MKLPVLWIAAAFAAGISLAIRLPVSVVAAAVVTIVALILAAGFLWRRFAVAAWVLALGAWFALGGLAIGVQQHSVPADHVTNLVDAHQIDAGPALRWRGRLREDPLALPWGRRYEIALEGVESAGTFIPVTGGLRANLYGEPRFDDALRNLRAGDRVEALLRAQEPRNFLDPGAFDLRGYMTEQKVDLTGSLRSGELLRLIDRPRPTVSQRLARIRGDLLARLDALFKDQPQRAAVLRAMLLGDRSFVESDVVLAFQKTAAYHVLVVAGLHVGAIVIFLFWLCRRLRFSMAATSLVTLVALAGYVSVVQDRPPILRAALMAAFYIIARPLFRRIDLLNTVALAALVLLLWNPSSLADSSFQLSFLAAGVIAGLALPWMDRSTAPYRAGLAHLGDVTRDAMHPPKVAQFRIEFRAASHWLAARCPAWLASRMQSILALPIRAGLRLWEIVLLSLAIQLGMMPLLAQDFHRVSLSGPVSNIPAVILTGIIVPLGFLALIATFVWSRLAWLLAKICGLCAGLLLATVEWFSRLPRMSYRIPGPPVWLVVAFFAALIVLASIARARSVHRANRFVRRQPSAKISAAEWIGALSLAVLTILVASHPFAPNLSRGDMEVTILDVGQGDSIFAAFPDGRTMLVDGGGLAGSEWIGGYRSGTDVGEEVVSPYLWSRGLKYLDVVALTHADHDHIDGLYAVLDNFRVGELWIGDDDDRAEFKGLLDKARARGTAIVHKKKEDDFDWGGAQGAVLWPLQSGPVGDSANDDSLVLHLSDGRDSFLLTGDIGERTEEKLAETPALLTADFLKVPHHGSKTSSTQNFLAAVAPKIAVVSVGQSNPYGHPAASTVERYEEDGIRLLRTDRDGAVTILSNGKDLTVHSYVDNLRAK